MSHQRASWLVTLFFQKKKIYEILKEESNTVISLQCTRTQAVTTELKKAPTPPFEPCVHGVTYLASKLGAQQKCLENRHVSLHPEPYDI